MTNKLDKVDLKILKILQSNSKITNLDLSKKIEHTIKKYSDSSNPVTSSKGSQDIRRNSNEIIFNWKKQLTFSEIERIRTQVEDIACFFYSESEW